MKNKGEITLITGASGGIGLDLAYIFAREGSDLILVARSEKKLQEIKKYIESKHSVKVYVEASDLSTIDGASALVDRVKAKNLKVDNLVNNAGVGVYGDFALETEWQKEKELLQLNIIALSELTNAFLPSMVKSKKGRIMNVASTAAFQPGPGMATYFASKAYVLHFSEAIAEEVAKSGVLVSALCPGATETGFQSSANMGESKLFKSGVATSKEVAEYGYESLMNGKRVAVHGLKNCLLVQSVRIAPRILAAKIARKFQERDH